MIVKRRFRVGDKVYFIKAADAFWSLWDTDQDIPSWHTSDGLCKVIEVFEYKGEEYYKIDLDPLSYCAVSRLISEEELAPRRRS